MRPGRSEAKRGRPAVVILVVVLSIAFTIGRVVLTRRRRGNAEHLANVVTGASLGPADARFRRDPSAGFLGGRLFGRQGLY
jgi:hypothetical protein